MTTGFQCPALSPSWTQVLPIKNSGSISGGIAFSPDGKYLAAGIGVIGLWDPPIN